MSQRTETESANMRPEREEQDEHYLKKELYGLVRENPLVFDFLQNGSLDGIWYWDLEKPENEWMSPRFWEVFGYEPTEKRHLAEAWQNMIHPQDLQLALDNFHRHSKDPNHAYDQLVRYRHKDGSTVWVRCRGLAIRDRHGNPVRMLGAHTEVTELKEVQAALEKKTTELERTNRELEQFVYAASHDLQEPLRTISGYLQLLHQRYANRIDADANQFMEFAVDAAARLQTMISDLLLYARTSTPNHQRVQETDCDEIVASVLSFLERVIQDTQATVTCDPLPTLMADGGQLTQLWQNLISNAIKFHGENPPLIHISAHEGENEWLFSIRDHGVGLDAEYVDQIFAMFRRLHSRSRYPGTGIGLALCKKIVELHGGRIWVKSAPGKGATFFFTIPVESTSTRS